MGRVRGRASAAWPCHRRHSFNSPSTACTTSACRMLCALQITQHGGLAHAARAPSAIRHKHRHCNHEQHMSTHLMCPGVCVLQADSPARAPLHGETAKCCCCRARPLLAKLLPCNWCKHGKRCTYTARRSCSKLAKVVQSCLGTYHGRPRLDISHAHHGQHRRLQACYSSITATGDSRQPLKSSAIRGTLPTLHP